MGRSVYPRPGGLGKGPLAGATSPGAGNVIAGPIAGRPGLLAVRPSVLHSPPMMRCLPALVTTFLLVQIPAIIAGLSALDLDRLREILRRIVEFIALGGVALALLCGLVFLLTWVLSHLRRPSDQSRRWLSVPAATLAWVPVLLTGVAAAGIFIPALAPFILRSFALAVVVAAGAWCVSVAALIAGGTRRDLRRTRRAIILAGTPWYCLVVYLATYL